jgi:hypothetical protein
MKSLPVFDHAKKTSDAIICLCHAGHHVAAVMLIYAAIDQMSWLSIPGPMSYGPDFKNWVKKYMLENGNLICSEDDLWAARCGLLHTGTAESKDFRLGTAKNKIFYSFGNTTWTNNSKKREICLSIETMVEAYLAGVMWFIEELENDPVQLPLTLTKVTTILTTYQSTLHVD